MHIQIFKAVVLAGIDFVVVVFNLHNTYCIGKHYRSLNDAIEKLQMGMSTLLQ